MNGESSFATNATSQYGGEVSTADCDIFAQFKYMVTDILLVFGLVFSVPFLIAIGRLSKKSYSAEGGTSDEHRISQQMMFLLFLLFFVILANCIFHGLSLAKPPFEFESRATIPNSCPIEAAVVNMSVPIALWLVACVSRRVYVSLSKDKGKFSSNETYMLVSICPAVVTTTVLALRDKLGPSGVPPKPGDSVELDAFTRHTPSDPSF